MTSLQSSRFTAQSGHLLIIETPQEAAPRLLDALLAADPLTQGANDRVAFTSAPGIQQFRALGTGHNRASGDRLTVPCVDLRIFTMLQGGDLSRLVEAAYHAHPDEEPVILLIPTTRTHHVPGQDEDNPNRFWNRPTADWVPEPHRESPAQAEARLGKLLADRPVPPLDQHANSPCAGRGSARRSARNPPCAVLS